MLSELSSSVAALVKNKDSLYLRKKALIVALITTKVAPEVAQVFIEPALYALTDPSSAIKLSGAQLAAQLIVSVEGAHEKFLKNLVQYTKLLSELAKQTTTSDNEMGGVNDPFLQIALLRLIEVIIAKAETIEVDFVRRQLSETLENIVTTQHKKGESVPARVAIQFEAARCIMTLP